MARQSGVAASPLFQWREVERQGALTAVCPLPSCRCTRGEAAARPQSGVGAHTAAAELRKNIPLLLTHFMHDAALRFRQMPIAPAREGAFERAVIEEALRRHGGSANNVRAELKINNSTLYRKMKALNLELLNYRRGAE